MLFRSTTTAFLLASIPTILAQTYTACSPLNTTCPADKGLAQSTYTRDFTTQDLTGWSSSSTDLITQNSNGINFKITADGQDPTLTSSFYIFFGRVDVTIKAAPGVGIVSAIVLESDDLDEIDWEFLGGDTTQAQSNYFGKGDTSTYDRGAYHPVTTPQSVFHTYSIDWTSERIQWLIDGVVMRTLTYSAAGAAKYPQTPSQIKLGTWVAGGANNAAGTVQWAGGKTDFSQAPFVGYVSKISVTNYNPAASYSYGDHSGSYQSIQQSGSVAGSAASSSSSSSTTSTTSTSSAIASSTTLSTSTTAQTSITTTVLVSSSIMAAVPNKGGASSSTSSISTAVISTTTIAASSSGAVYQASSGFHSSTTASNSASATSTAPARQTGNSAASVSINAAGSLLGLAAAFFML